MGLDLRVALERCKVQRGLAQRVLHIRGYLGQWRAGVWLLASGGLG